MPGKISRLVFVIFLAVFFISCAAGRPNQRTEFHEYKFLYQTSLEGKKIKNLENVKKIQILAESMGMETELFDIKKTNNGGIKDLRLKYKSKEMVICILFHASSGQISKLTVAGHVPILEIGKNIEKTLDAVDG